MRIVVLGRPGSGKGTQVPRVAERLGCEMVATSSLLRNVADTETPRGEQVREAMRAGGLVPDDLVVATVAGALAAAGRCVLLDGFPRTVGQAEALRTLLPGEGIDLAIELAVPAAHVAERVRDRMVCPSCAAPVALICERCGLPGSRRPDDRPDVMLRRLWAYELETAPVVRWFDRLGLLVSVDGTGDVDDVTDRLLAAIGARTPPLASP